MKNHGFTLLELIITIALAAILLGLAVPSMHTFIQNNRISGQTNELVAALNLARSEAIKRGRGAWVCASADPDAENPACSGNDDWDDGWLVVAVTPGGSEVVRAWQAPGIHVNLTFQGDNANHEVRFASSGMLQSSPNPDTHSDCPSAICFELEVDDAGCRGGDDLGHRQVFIPVTGGTRVVTRACPD